MSYDTKAGKSYRARLYLGRKCVHRIGSKKLQGIPPERVESLVAAAAAAYEERFLGPKKTEVPQPTTAVPQGPEFDYYVAKERFLDAVEVEIGSDRRRHLEDYFRLSIEPYFVQTLHLTDPTQWAAHFDRFRSWLRERPRADGQAGHIAPGTANHRIVALNKFLKFCRTVYGLHLPTTCTRFSKRMVKQAASRDQGVWNEEQFETFRGMAYKEEPFVAPIFDLAFGLGLRRGEAVALRQDAVHLDDTRLSPMGHVDIVRQLALDWQTRRDVIRPPKWDRTRSVPINYPWLAEMLRERLNGYLPTEPWKHGPGLRYVVSCYSNLAIAKALGVSECSVRNYLKKAGVERRRRIETPVVDEAVQQDIRSHLLSKSRVLKPTDYLFVSSEGKLLLPASVSAVFTRLVKQSGLPAIRLHDLRHSFGTLWAERLSPMVLKSVMGHSSITTTERYVHSTDEIIRASVDRALAAVGKGA